MPTSPNHIVIQVIVITAIFLITAGFLLVYVNIHNKRKKRFLEEKKDMQHAFEHELISSKMEVQEYTLQTIARDIHDNIGQLLSLTRVSLSTVDVDDEPARAKEKIASALALLDTSIKDLRQLAAILHAENILKTGLQNAVERELERLAKAGDFETHFEFTGEKITIQDPQKELIIFRIVQETLNNIIKHASASRINIIFRYARNILSISVADNGKGFDIASGLNNTSGMGLTNLSKRAKMIGGDIIFESSGSTGTKVTLIVPISSN